MRAGGPAKILFFEGNIDGTIGGSYYSLLHLTAGLDRRRFQPIAAFCSEHSLLSAYRLAGVETDVWPPITSPLRGGGSGSVAARGSFRRPSRGLAKVRPFLSELILPAVARARYLRRHDIRIVHLNNSILHNHEWMLGARLAGVACLTHERGINARFPFLARYFGRRLDAVICISEAVRANLLARTDGFSNLITIHNGLDAASLRIRKLPRELRAAHGIEDQSFVVGMIGNIKAWKGQETVVRAISRVRQSCPEVRCLLVGDTAPADRPYRDSLVALVSALGLEHQVLFTGFQSNVADFIQASDVIVHASVLPEPFGRVILEAMACQKPVIAAHAGAIPEIVLGGRTGLLFPPGDDERLAQVIFSLAGARDRAREMGVLGFARLAAEFSIKKNVEATERLYTRLLDARV